MLILVALLAALAPANPVPIVTNQALAQARDRWLIVTLTLGVIWLCMRGEWWLAIMGAWFVVAWAQNGHEALEHLLPWLGIGAGSYFVCPPAHTQRRVDELRRTASRKNSVSWCIGCWQSSWGQVTRRVPSDRGKRSEATRGRPSSWPHARSNQIA